MSATCRRPGSTRPTARGGAPAIGERREPERDRRIGDGGERAARQRLGQQYEMIDDIAERRAQPEPQSGEQHGADHREDRHERSEPGELADDVVARRRLRAKVERERAALHVARDDRGADRQAAQKRRRAVPADRLGKCDVLDHQRQLLGAPHVKHLVREDVHDGTGDERHQHGHAEPRLEPPPCLPCHRDLIAHDDAPAACRHPGAHRRSACSRGHGSARRSRRQLAIGRGPSGRARVRRSRARRPPRATLAAPRARAPARRPRARTRRRCGCAPRRAGRRGAAPRSCV